MSLLNKIVRSNLTIMKQFSEQSCKVCSTNISLSTSPYNKPVHHEGPKCLPIILSSHSNRSLHSSTVHFQVQDLRYKDYLRKVNEGMQIVDVRNPREIKNMGGVKGSFEIPLDQLEEAFMLSPEEWEQKFKRGKPSEDTPILVICAAGVRSKAGVKILQQMGYKQPLSYRGGYKMFKDKK